MTQRCKAMCIYVDGDPQPQAIMLLPHDIPLPHKPAEVVMVVSGEVHIFTKEEAKEFLKQRLKLKNFEIGPCPNTLFF